MTDETESIRREMLRTKQPQADLAKAEMRWDTDQLRDEFEVIGFLAPFVAVRRKRDGKTGSLEFTHSPRFYFNFVEGLPVKTYQFRINERELEVALTAIGLQAEAYATAGYQDDAKEARALMVRLDTEADQQFLQKEYPQHAG